ncbi:MAG TPA: NlpC/P60 family protein [Gaiellaceae bacterium]|nr:NlpC/P60 family protein [Gaiellaceae bacterium]
MTGIFKRQAWLFLLALVVALAAASAAFATPGTVSGKQAEARAVLGQIQGLDANLEHAVEAYNLANQKLAGIEADLRENKVELRVARSNLRHAQTVLSARLVAMYTSGGENTGLEVLLGASSIDDLMSRIDTVNRVSDQSAEVLREVKIFRTAVREREARLKNAHVEQAKLVAERSAEKASIEGQLSQRRQLLSSIKSEIDRIQAAERVRQAQLAAEARARLATNGAEVLSASAGAISDPAGPIYAPPPGKYGGVVGIAMQYLGTPYVYGGASPSGFDCSGFVMYVFAQVGVSLPHNAAAQYGYGMPVSRDQLQAGDLVFFNGLGHVGIYIGGGQFIHSPHTGDVVKISSLSGWYSSTYVGARRL